MTYKYDTTTKGLYKVFAIKNGKTVATMKAIAFTRRDAYSLCEADFPLHNTWDASRIREAENQPIGVVYEKNDKKRKP